MQGKSQPIKREERSLNLPEVLVNQLGHNAVLRRLIQERVPLTVKNYVDLNWMGHPPEHLDEEDQETLAAIHEYETAHAQNVKQSTLTRGR